MSDKKAAVQTEISLDFIVLTPKLKKYSNWNLSFNLLFVFNPQLECRFAQTKLGCWIFLFYDKDDLERSGEQDSNNLEEICNKVVNQITGDYTNNDNTLSSNIWGIL